MNTHAVIGFLIYLALGWFFVHWFVNDFLDDGRWSDSDRKPTGAELVLMHLAWILMLIVLAIAVVTDYASTRKRNVIQWFYGIKE